MANLDFCDKHNMHAFLEKPEGSEDFQQILDFLNSTHTKYSLTENPTIYVSLIHKFWATAFSSTSEDEEMKIITTINGKVKTFTETSIRRHLKLEDSNGITSLSNTEIFEQLALMGAKKTAWDKFSSNIATTIICLATNRKFNFSKMIFDALVKNLDSQSKFIIYPRFLQICLNKHKRHLLTHKKTYLAPTLTQKLFSNMRRAPKGYNEVDILLFPTMIVQEPIDQIKEPPVPTSAPSTLQQLTSPPSLETTHVEEEPATTSPRSLEEDLKQTKKIYGKALTKLVKKVKHLEDKLKSTTERKRARMALSDDEEDLVSDDSSKQGRMSEDIDQDDDITLVTPTKVSISTADTVDISTPSPVVVKDKGKGIMQESEPPKKIKKIEMMSIFCDNEFHALRIAPFSKAEVRKNMCIYLKNQGGYKLSYFKGMSSKDIRPLFEKVWDQNHAFVPKDSEIEKEVMKRSGFNLQQRQKGKEFTKQVIDEQDVVAVGAKRAGQEVLEEPAKRQKTREASVQAEEPKNVEPVELSQEELQKLVIIVPEEGMNVEALQVKYPIIDWEVFTEDMKLWSLVKERFSSTEPIDDKEKALWVELKRLFELDTDDLLELQRYMHDPLTWRLYNTCYVYHVAIEIGLDMFMLVERDYPLIRGLPILVFINKLQVDQFSEMTDVLLQKIFILAKRPRQ
ncbi:hypothetical protein Tco_1475902 [Tanacetum coccineum]